MALTEEQREVLADRSKLIYAQKDEEKRSAEIVKVTAGYGNDMGLAYTEVMTNLRRYQELADANKGIDPATANFVVGPGGVNVSAATKITSQGYGGFTSEVLVGAHLPENAGTSLALGGGVSVDARNKVAGGYLTAQYVGKDLVGNPEASVEVLPILKPTIVRGAEDKTSANVLLGAVTAQSNGFTHTDATIVANDGNLTQFHRTAYRINEPLGIEGLDASVYTTEAANIFTPKDGFGVRGLALGAGAFVNKDIGSGNALYADFNLTALNVETSGFGDVVLGAQGGLKFGAPPAPANVKVESAPADASYNLDVLNANEAARAGKTTVSVPAAPASENVAAASSPATKNLDYNFLELSEKEQQKVLTLMAETYKTTHPDVSTKEAKSIILDELAAVKYHVDAHGTTSRKDDTPMNDGYNLHTEIPHDEIAHTQR